MNTNIKHRQKLLICTLFLCGVLFILLSSSTSAEQARPRALILTIDGAISPAAAEYVKLGFKKARAHDYGMIILKLDTPGGLDKSMRLIIKQIVDSPIPVISYVAPSGARAASAGTFILYASHIAAMAPGTNLGAATPVSMIETPTAKKGKDKAKAKESARNKKVINDAVAYIKSLADLQGRNANWAATSITKAASIPAKEALQKNVINLMANDMSDLMKKLNGLNVKIRGQTETLNTTNIQLQAYKADWRIRFLSVITDPAVAYILLMIAVYGLFFEFLNPGAIVPGVIGAVCLLVALYALQLMPINYVGLLLLLLGLAFMTIEAFLPSIGVFGIAGAAAFAVGSIMLIDTEITGYGIPWYIIAGVTVLNLIFFLFVITMVIKARRRPVVSGKERLIGTVVTIDDTYLEQGTITLDGEIWRCKRNANLKNGDKAKITAVTELTLTLTSLSSNKER